LIIVTHIAELRSRLASERGVRTIGFVPTMGALHDGHLSLIRKAKQENDVVVLSIFVNPTQFAPSEDLDRYPRNVERDAELAEQAGCDIIFVPSVSEMYPEGFSTYVQVEGLSSVLEGAFRPTHFKGVTTVVLKLLNIVQPGTVYFGQKDVQQSIVIRTMVRDLDVPVRIDVVPTMREPDGLAMSSRNVYLDPVRRKNAPVLYAALQHASAMISAGERDPRAVIGAMERMITEKEPTQVDYITIVDAGTLAEKHTLSAGETVVIPLAVRFGTTRLIDNIVISIP
jgi:pantoate--beta-alanine ligase